MENNVAVRKEGRKHSHFVIYRRVLALSADFLVEQGWGGEESGAGVGSHAYFCIIILNSHQRGMQSEETALPKGPSKCLTAVPSAQYVFHQISKRGYVTGK